MSGKKYGILIATYLLAVSLILTQKAYAMHIMEGFLPINWCGFWFALIIPFLFMGIRSIQRTVKFNPPLKMLTE